MPGRTEVAAAGQSRPVSAMTVDAPPRATAVPGAAVVPALAEVYRAHVGFVWRVLRRLGVEDALYKHPAVLECAVIGVPSEKWGETPKALVVLREGASATEEEIIAFSRQHLAHFKCPTSIDFVPSLPRTATGKLQKFVIRDQYWQGATRRVN